MKTLRSLLFLLILSSAFAAFVSAEIPVVYCFKGPSAVAFSKLFEEGSSVKADALASPDLMVARFASGEAKVGVLPPNLAAKIAASGKHIAVVAVTGNGMLSLLSSDPSVRAVADLRGKEVYVHGQGSTPDYVLRRILQVNGIDPSKDINLRYSLSAPEIAQSLIAGRIAVALLPEPFTTMAIQGRPSLVRPFDVQAAWETAGGDATYPMTVLVVDRDFAISNRASIEKVIAACRESVFWTVANPEKAAAIVARYQLGMPAPVAAASIQRSAFVFISASQARPSLEALFKTFLSWAPASIGGKLPGDDFYYKP